MIRRIIIILIADKAERRSRESVYGNLAAVNVIPVPIAAASETPGNKIVSRAYY